MRTLAILTVSLSLGGCFQIPLSSSGSVTKKGGYGGLTKYATSTTMSESKEMASIDPDSSEATQLTAPKVEGLSGAAVVMPPGALGISASIVVEQASDFGETTITNEMGLSDDIQVTAASPGMIVRPTEAVDLKKPMVLAMPLPASLGFRLADAGSKYGVFYKYFDPVEQKLVTGLKVVDGTTVKMKFDEKAGREVIEFEGYFGAYWAAILSREVKVAEVPAPKPAEEPIVNKAKVAVIESVGIVSESTVVTKQALPELLWAKPILTYNAAVRSVSLTVALPTGATVTSCKADFYETAGAANGLTVEAPQGPSAIAKVTKLVQHSLLGRFRCTDQNGRMTITPWSDAVTIPASSLAAGDLDFCATSPAVPLGIWGYDDKAPTTLVRHRLLNNVAKCRFSLEVTVDEGGYVMFSNNDNNWSCSVPNGEFVIGANTLSCQRTTKANLGSFKARLSPGGYIVTLDFGASQTNPTLTMERRSCGFGNEIYAGYASGYLNTNNQLSAPLTSFEAPSAATKLEHIGGCLFVQNRPAIPVASDMSYRAGGLKIFNVQGQEICGAAPTEVWARSQNEEYRLSCVSPAAGVSVTPVIFKPLPSSFSNSLVVSLKGHDDDPTPFVKLGARNHCPTEMFVHNEANPNGVQMERSGACSFDVLLRTVETSSKNAFTIRSGDQKYFCGAGATPVPLTADGVIPFVCGTTPQPPIPVAVPAGKSIRLTFNGDAATASTSPMTQLSAYIQNVVCDPGLYLQDEVFNGTLQTKDRAFEEVAPCVFEKDWTPAAVDSGFYLSSGDGRNFLGNYLGYPNKPRLDMAPADLYSFWSGDGGRLGDLEKIQPQGLVASRPYRIRVERGGQDRVSVLTRANPSCGNLFLLSSDMTGEIASVPTSTGADANKLEARGECTYRFTLNRHFAAPAKTMNFVIGDGSSLICGLSGAQPQRYPGPADSRSADLNCSSASPVSVAVNPNDNLRVFIKRNPVNNTMKLTLQDMGLMESMSSLSMVGVAASAVVNGPVFEQTLRPIPEFESGYYKIWRPAATSTFTVNKSQDVNCRTFGQPNLGVWTDLVCNATSRAAPGTIGSFPMNDYFVEVRPARNLEQPAQIRIGHRNGFNGGLKIAQTGATDGTTAVIGVPNRTEDPANVPAAVRGGVTWTVGDMRYFFGGQNPSMQYVGDLWRYNRANQQWSRITGTGAVNEVNSSSYPAGRTNASGWFAPGVGASGTLYMFGGRGNGSAGGVGALGDLWAYDLSANTWELKKGSLEAVPAGEYGTKGVAHSLNTPAARTHGAAFVHAGYLYLYAGAHDNGTSYYNDLWKYDTASGNWTWLSGEDAPGSTGNVSTPAARVPLASWYKDGIFHVYGGKQDTAEVDLWRLDLNGYVWTGRRFWSGNLGIAVVAPSTFAQDNFPGNFTLAENAVQSFVTPGGFLLMKKSNAYWAFSPMLGQFAFINRLENPYSNDLNTAPVSSYTDNGNVFSDMTVVGSSQDMQIFGNSFFGGSVYQAGTPTIRNNMFEIQLPAAKGAF